MFTVSALLRVQSPSKRHLNLNRLHLTNFQGDDIFIVIDSLRSSSLCLLYSSPWFYIQSKLVVFELLLNWLSLFFYVLAVLCSSDPKQYQLKLRLHDAIYRLGFCSYSLIHTLLLSNLHSNVASIQKNRGDKSDRVIVALNLSF